MAASPTLYLHGLGIGLPSILWVRGAAVWALLGITASFIRQEDWWLLVAIVAVAPLVPKLVDREQADASIHPIGGGLEPWPGNSFRAPSTNRPISATEPD